MKLLFLNIAILFIAIEIYRNYYIIIIKKKRPNYLFSNILRIVVLIVLNLLYCKSISTEYTFLCIALFAVLFDPFLALSEGKSPFYINRTASAGWYDKFLTSLGNLYIMYVWTEVIILLLALTTYYAGFGGLIDMITGDYNWNNWIW